MAWGRKDRGRGRYNGRALTASAKVDPFGLDETGEVKQGKTGLSGSARAWQEEAWNFYDAVPELSYSVGFIGNCFARCRLTVGLPDEDGKIGPAFDEDGKALAPDAPDALELLKALRSGVGGQPQVMRGFGENLGLTGECYLFGVPPKGTDPGRIPSMKVTELSWQVLSTAELKPQGKGYKRVRYPGDTGEEIAASECHVVRVWRPHPKYSEMARSSVWALRDILEELVLLTREVRGDALSRLANNGVFVVPDEIDFAKEDEDDDDEDEGDPLTAEIITVFSQAIADKGTAAQVVPFVIRAPYDLCDRIQFIELKRPPAGDQVAKRTEAVQRFAQGFDLPVEVVTGHAGTTFSNAVQIDDATFKVHIEPLLEAVADALTVGYLHPAMPGTQLVVYFDSSELVTRPNRSADADQAFDRMAISWDAYRDAKGFGKGDAPDEDELRRRIEIEVMKHVKVANQAATGAADKISSEGSDLLPGQGPGALFPSNGSPTGNGTQNGESITAALAAAAIGAAAEVAVDRAVCRAGARLRSKAAKIQPIRDSLQTVPDREVALTLGPGQVEQLTTSPDELFHGEFDALHTWAMRRYGARLASHVRAQALVLAVERLYAPMAPFPAEAFVRDNNGEALVA